MVYPARSTAWSGFADDCWWQTQYNGELHLCMSQGRTVVKSLQTVLRSILPLAYTVQGSAFARYDLVVDGNFGPYTFAGMGRALEEFDASTATQHTLQADYQRLTGGSGSTVSGARGQPIALATMQCVLWLAVHRNLTEGDVLVQPDMVTLRFAEDTIDDGDADGLVTCVPMSQVGAVTPQGRDTIPLGGTGPSSVPGTELTPRAPTAAPSGGDDVVLIGLGLLGLALAAGSRKGL
jgi:hypothetical protein